MLAETLARQLYESLKFHRTIRMEVAEPVHVAGHDLSSFRQAMIDVDNISRSTLHRSGTYIIGSTTEVIRVGEGGPSKKNPEQGTMAARIYAHIRKDRWMTEARICFFVPFTPREFSRLGEQTALALHFQVEYRLPKFNPDWR